MTIAESLRQTRYEAGKSQEFMAYELDVSRRTVQNWESAVSEPTIGQAIDWFKLCGKNPIPYILQYAYPNTDRISEKDSDEKLRAALLDLVKEMPPEAVRQIMYLFFGDHGSSPRAVMQLVTAHLQTPMKDRLTQAEVITKNYEIAKKKGTVARPNHIQPDVEYLRKAIATAEAAVLENAEEYSVNLSRSRE